MDRPSPRIQVHDFAGHPFQADLSRELARRGFQVDHVFSAQYSSGKGRLHREFGDSETLTFTPIRVDAEFDKYSPVGRAHYELAYAAAWKRHVKTSNPDCVIACNVPLLTLNRFRAWASRVKQPWILWHQDIFSLAMGDELDRRFPAPVARLGRSYFTSTERKAVASASRVIAIGEEFRKLYLEWGIDPSAIEIIPNWAPVDDIKPTESENSWAFEKLESGKGLRLLYAGMLGRKHNPQLLIDLLDAISSSHDAELVVVSEGDGADDLRTVATARPEAAITVLPFQSAENLSQVLGSGDVLVAILEPEASKFSIPSKVLSYMSAGRPILGLMPDDNPAAQDILATDGFVATPDAEGVKQSVAWLTQLIDDPELIKRTGRKARKLAEEKFGVEPITDRFVAVIEKALTRSCPTPQSSATKRSRADTAMAAMRMVNRSQKFHRNRELKSRIPDRIGIHETIMIAPKIARLRFMVRRLLQTLTQFNNGPQLIIQFVKKRMTGKPGEVLFHLKDGLVIASPNNSGTRSTVFEILVEDMYRLTWFTSGLGPTPVAVDIGAHIGSFSLAFTRLYPAGTVGAYEASPVTASYLKRNVQANRLADRVDVHAEAVSAAHGTLAFADNGVGSPVNGLTAPADTAMIDVPCVTLSEALSARGVPVDLVKIDTEGAEYGMVLASSDSDWASVRRVVIEYHHVPGHSWSELQTFFTRLGFAEAVHESVDGQVGTVWLTRDPLD